MVLQLTELPTLRKPPGAVARRCGAIASAEDGTVLWRVWAPQAGHVELVLLDGEERRPRPMSKEADGILDFTVPAATIANVAIAAERGLVHVVGTTGLSASDNAVIKSVTNRAVVVQSGNMSLGVNLLAAVVKRVAKALDESFDIEIVEAHHRMKVDAPSGTALMLGQAAASGRGIALDEHADRGRDGITGARKPGDIGFASLRGGTAAGDHSVSFLGPFERLTLSHHAEDRMLFAHGALKAALWAHGKKPGHYSMADVLGLSDI